MVNMDHYNITLIYIPSSSPSAAPNPRTMPPLAARSALLLLFYLGGGAATLPRRPSAAFAGNSPASIGSARQRQAAVAAPLSPPASRSYRQGTGLAAAAGEGQAGAPSKAAAGKEEEKPLEVEAIAELVEVAFVNACLQLASGYVDVLKLFAVAVKAGYERGMPLVPDLIGLVEACPVETANRPLMDEEAALRRTWMGLVYLTLEAEGHASSSNGDEGGVEGRGANSMGSTVDAADREAYGPLIEVLAPSKGTITLDEAVAAAGDGAATLTSLLGLDEPLKKALIMQNMRVIRQTFVALEEEALCHEGGGTTGPSGARPHIPGAFKD